MWTTDMAPVGRQKKATWKGLIKLYWYLYVEDHFYSIAAILLGAIYWGLWGWGVYWYSVAIFKYYMYIYNIFFNQITVI
jgi:hypothetical protein